MKHQLVTALALCALAAIVVTPAMAQTEDQVQGSIKSHMSEAPDPGFAHNHTGRHIGQYGSIPDYGTYCGPLPSHVCHQGGYNFVLLSDPFSPVSWGLHGGNLAAVQTSQKKGWPLQTLIVTMPDGSAAANARVRFFETGYNRARGTVGVTDANGRFQIAVKRVKRSHRFVVEVPGHNKSRLDIVGKEIFDAQHQIVLSKWGQSDEQLHQVAAMGDMSVPKQLEKDYRRAEKALDAGKWDVAIAELRALIERWPVGTIEGAEYQPQALLIQALQGAGQPVLAKQVERKTPAVVSLESAG